MNSRVRICAGGLVAVLLSAMPAAAQSDRAAYRDVARKWQNAIVNVRISLKVRMSMGGREVQSMDDTVEAVGTVIDPSGLTVMSLTSLDPGAMMSKLMGGAAGEGDQKVSIVSEPSNVRIRLADGKELPATIVLRDEDLDLAFIKPTAKPAEPLVAVNLSDAGKPVVLEQIVVLSRLGRVGGWSPAAAVHDIGAIMERPRTFYVLQDQAVTGTPAFQSNGKVIGLLTIRQIDPGRMSMFGMMNGTEGAGVIAVVLPAADVLEIAKQIEAK